MTFRIYAVLMAAVFVVAAGCTQSASTISPEMLSSYQSELSLAIEPDQAASVLEVRALLGGDEGTTENQAEATAPDLDEAAAHDHDDKGHHTEDGHEHDTDGPKHVEHDGLERAEHVQDHEGHDDGDAHGKHEDPDGHEHGEDGHEHAEHAHDHAEHGHPHSYDGHEVVIVGKIGGADGADSMLSDFPWEKGLASFIISDPSFEPAHDHDHEHAHEDHECHFCQAAAGDAQAWVRFLGDDNKPIAVGARELFDVKEGDIVVVKGHAKISAGILIVNAKGIYVRR